MKRKHNKIVSTSNLNIISTLAYKPSVEKRQLQVFMNSVAASIIYPLFSPTSSFKGSNIFLKDLKNSLWIMIFLNRLRCLWDTIYIRSKAIFLTFLVSCSNEEYAIEGSLTLNTNNRTFDKETTISKEATYKENICVANKGMYNCFLIKILEIFSHFYYAESELEK